MMKITGTKAHVIHQLFQTILVTYLVLLVVEQLFTGAITAYLNLNYVLIVVIVLGVLDVFSEKPHSFSTERKVTRKDYIFIIVLGILGAVIIKYKTASLDWLSWLISIVAGVLIILLSLLILQDEETH